MSHLVRAACVIALLSVTTTAGGQNVTTPNEEADLDARDSLARAKDLFREGVALYQAGEVHLAFDRFRRSRDLYPSAKNTVNAALCLEKLGRFDEALELFEVAIAQHQREMDASDLEGVRVAMSRLRSQVGNLTISYTAIGSIVIDGRPRGTLPLPAPLRLMPGRHVVRVIKNGYATFEEQVEVRAGQTVNVDARLQALTASGVLRVEDDTHPDARVIVDGAVVGVCPWEGMLAPGTHVVQTEADGAAGTQHVSPPTKGVVVRGQTTLLRLTSVPAGPKVFLEVLPTTAELSVNGVQLGRGRWEGHLPVGRFSIAGSEEGYLTKARQVVVQEGSGAVQRVTFRLVVDEQHPRWPNQPTGRLWFQAYTSMAVGPSLRSGPESDCRAGCPSSIVLGFAGAGRVGYELPWKLSVEVTAGYLTLWSKPSRGATERFGAGDAHQLDYQFDDVVRFKGPFVGGGASYPVPAGRGWSLRGRITVGAVFASSLDAVEGTARSSVDELAVYVENAGRSVDSTPVFVTPELGVEHKYGPIVLSLSLGWMFVPNSGPALPLGSTSVPTEPCRTNEASAACARQSSLAGERAYGAFSILLPTVHAAYAL